MNADAQSVDRYGDPLPKHAIQRLGTIRHGAAAKMGECLRPHKLVFSPDGRNLASVNDSGVALWDVATGKTKVVLENASEFRGVDEILFSQDSGRLIADDFVFDVTTGKIVERPRYGWSFSHVQGKWDYFPPYEAIAGRNKIGIYRRGTREPLTEFTFHKAEVSAIAFSQDGKYLASGDVTGGCSL